MKTIDLGLETAGTKAAERANLAMYRKDRQALEYILEDERGRWFFMRLLESCHILSSTYPPEDHTNRMLVYEGERRVGLNLLARTVGDLKDLRHKQQAESEYYAFMQRMEEQINLERAKEV